MNITLGHDLLESIGVSLNSTTVYILLLIVVLNIYFFGSLQVFKRKRYPSGPWGVPVFGHLPFFGQSPPQTFSKWREQFGDVYSIRLGSWKTVVVNGHDAIKEAADKPNDDFSGRPSFVTQQLLSKLTGGQSLAFGQFNHTYLHQRKLTSSALRKFTNRSGDVTEEMIVGEANDLVDSIVSKGSTTPQNIKPDIQYAVGSIIYQFLYGPGKHLDRQKQLKSMVESANKFIKFAGNGNPFDVMPWLRYVMPWKIDQFFAIMTENDQMRHEQVKEHMETFSSDNIRDVTDAFIAAELDENEIGNSDSTYFSKLRLLSTLVDLQGAGFDTTNKTLQWLIMYMASYPEVQTRVQKEIDGVIGSENDVTYKSHPQLVYTEATIHEVMRITAMIPFALPKYTTRDTKLEGYDIDQDTVVFFNIHSVSHDKVFWGDPENFRPSRFLTEDENQLDVTKCNRVIPFGVGRRRCVGEFLAKMEVFILFVTVMRRCMIMQPLGEVYDLDPVPGLVYSPTDFKVIVKERS